MPELALSFYIAGIPIQSARDSFVRTYSGGIAQTYLTASSTLGQASVKTLAGFDVEFVPTNSTDETALRNILHRGGGIPILLPDTTRVGALFDEGGQEVQGYVANKTQVYKTKWLVPKSLIMADLCWRGSTPGQHAYVRGGTAMASLGNRTLLSDNGWKLDAGAGTVYAAHYITDNTPSGVYTLRSQPTLYADITILAGDPAIGALGLGQSGSLANRPFGANGCGIIWSGDEITLAGDGDTGTTTIDISRPANIQVIIIARPRGARVEVWDGSTRLGWSNNVDFTITTNFLRPIVQAKTGAVILHQWWMYQG